MARFQLVLLILTFIFCPIGDTGGSLRAQNAPYIAVGSGAPVSVPSVLRITQNGELPLRFNARYRSRPFDGPIYYVIKFGFSLLQSDWQLQFIHHKLFLQEPPADIQHFEVTHGFNILSINRLIDLQRVHLLAGVGVVLPSIEYVIRNKRNSSHGGFLGTRYSLTGPVIVLGFGKRVSLSKNVFVVLEAQLIGSYVKVGIPEGEVRLTNFSGHGVFALGFSI